MNKFEEKIKEQVDKRRSGLVLEEGIHTIGEFVSAVLTVENAEDAKVFYDGYLEYLKQWPETKGENERLRVAKSNIGWCFGEGMAPDKIKMWNEVCGASHPVFGTGIPSPEEAFEAGKKIGKGT